MPDTKVKLTSAAKKLLELVPPDGTFIGNKKLQRRSKLGKRHWKVQKELVSKGVLTPGKGRRGSVAQLAADGEVGRAPIKGKSAVRLSVAPERGSAKTLPNPTAQHLRDVRSKQLL